MVLKLMNINRVFRFAILPLLLCLTASLPAWGRREGKNSTTQSLAAPEERISVVQEEKSDSTQSVVVQVSGRVRLVGSSPFSDLVITGLNMEWYIERAEMAKLVELQHRTVIVEGAETVMQLISANGRPAGQRRILRDITIIAVE